MMLRVELGQVDGILSLRSGTKQRLPQLMDVEQSSQSTRLFMDGEIPLLDQKMRVQGEPFHFFPLSFLSD